MRRLLALAALLALVQLSTGCRHVAGSCDCDHAGNRVNGGGGCGCGTAVASPSNPGVCGYYGSAMVAPVAPAPVTPGPVPPR